jgi:hypothetical protein
MLFYRAAEEQQAVLQHVVAQQLVLQHSDAQHPELQHEHSQPGQVNASGKRSLSSASSSGLTGMVRC